METPRPSLIINGTYGRHPKLRIPTMSHEDEVLIRKILAVHRRRQTRKLGARSEDPDPYDPSYIFFCLDGRRET